MTTPCPHCFTKIEIDPATQAALRDHTHFACPACQGLVPVPTLTRPQLQLNPAPGARATTAAFSAHRPHRVSTTSRRTNRNLLILGSTALLVLGAIAFVLASRKSGNTHVTTQNIRNEIINNSYFTQLIASGATTEKDLNSIAEIRPYENGFIGISSESLNWGSAQDLARRTGSTILGPKKEVDSGIGELLRWIAQAFPSESSKSLWMAEHGEARVLANSEILAVQEAQGERRVLLHWQNASLATGSRPGRGKRVVLLAGDVEYRSEEALPQLAKILSQRHGFDCTVLHSINKQTGEIDPKTKDNHPGLEALASADLVITSLFFRNWPDAQMKHFAAYLASGKPIIALRTSTHAFKDLSGTHAAFNRFGEDILGTGWISHWGNHKRAGGGATRGVIEPTAVKDVLLQGVTDIFAETNVYEVALPADARVLVRGVALNGDKPGSSPASYIKKRANGEEQDVNSPPMPIIWTRTASGPLGNGNQVLCITAGSASDLQNEGLRRLVVNGVYSFTGLAVPKAAVVEPVGVYEPSSDGDVGFIKGKKPEDYFPGK